jgi:N-acetylglucosaminyldiphosphoundecaprenol N-acetyl-beta-D-mannosaminyltransferase
VDLLGVKFHAITERQCVLRIADELAAGRGGWAVTPNLDILRQSQADGQIRKLLESASLVVADGMPLIWASRLQGTPLPERVAGSNLISSLTAEAAGRGFSIFFLGGSPGTAQAAAELLAARHPGFRIAGISCPEPGFEKSESGVGEVVRDLVSAKPDIIFVGLGFPKQEKLIETLRTAHPCAW